MCFGLRKKQLRQVNKHDIGDPFDFRIVQHIGYNNTNLNYDVKSPTNNFLFEFFYKQFESTNTDKHELKIGDGTSSCHPFLNECSRSAHKQEVNRFC